MKCYRGYCDRGVALKFVDGSVKPERILVSTVESDFEGAVEVAVIFDHVTLVSPSNIFVSITPENARKLAAYLIQIANDIEGTSIDDLITMSEAAELLRGEATDTTLAYIGSLVLRGKLIRYEDKNEPNPQRNGRVSRKAVMELKDNLRVKST